MNSGTKSEHFLEFRSLCRAFEDGFVAVDNFNLTIKQGEFVTFLGPSGWQDHDPADAGGF